MAPSRPRVSFLKKVTPQVPSVEAVAVSLPKPAGVRKPQPSQARKPIARGTLRFTRAYTKEVEEAKLKGLPEPDPRPIQPRQSIATAAVPAVIARPALQSSALPAPTAPANTETELENLMTIGREQVEKELKDRIKEEQEKKRLLEKQKTALKKYQTHLADLKDLEDELNELKEENRLDEDTVMELAEEFRENTMEWARLFEEYAGKLGITVFDIRKLADAW